MYRNAGSSTWLNNCWKPQFQNLSAYGHLECTTNKNDSPCTPSRWKTPCGTGTDKGDCCEDNPYDPAYLPRAGFPGTSAPRRNTCEGVLDPLGCRSNETESRSRRANTSCGQPATACRKCRVQHCDHCHCDTCMIQRANFYTNATAMDKYPRKNRFSETLALSSTDKKNSLQEGCAASNKKRRKSRRKGPKGWNYSIKLEPPIRELSLREQEEKLDVIDNMIKKPPPPKNNLHTNPKPRKSKGKNPRKSNTKGKKPQGSKVNKKENNKSKSKPIQSKDEPERERKRSMNNPPRSKPMQDLKPKPKGCHRPMNSKIEPPVRSKVQRISVDPPARSKVKRVSTKDSPRDVQTASIATSISQFHIRPPEKFGPPPNRNQHCYPNGPNSYPNQVVSEPPRNCKPVNCPIGCYPPPLSYPTDRHCNNSYPNDRPIYNHRFEPPSSDQRALPDHCYPKGPNNSPNYRPPEHFGPNRDTFNDHRKGPNDPLNYFPVDHPAMDSNDYNYFGPSDRGRNNFGSPQPVSPYDDPCTRETTASYGYGEFDEQNPNYFQGNVMNGYQTEANRYPNGRNGAQSGRNKLNGNKQGYPNDYDTDSNSYPRGPNGGYQTEQSFKTSQLNGQKKYYPDNSYGTGPNIYSTENSYPRGRNNDYPTEPNSRKGDKTDAYQTRPNTRPGATHPSNFNYANEVPNDAIQTYHPVRPMDPNIKVQQINGPPNYPSRVFYNGINVSDYPQQQQQGRNWSNNDPTNNSYPAADNPNKYNQTKGPSSKGRGENQRSNDPSSYPKNDNQRSNDPSKKSGENGPQNLGVKTIPMNFFPKDRKSDPIRGLYTFPLPGLNAGYFKPVEINKKMPSTPITGTLRPMMPEDSSVGIQTGQLVPQGQGNYFLFDPQPPKKVKGQGQRNSGGKIKKPKGFNGSGSEGDYDNDLLIKRTVKRTIKKPGENGDSTSSEDMNNKNKQRSKKPGRNRKPGSLKPKSGRNKVKGQKKGQDEGNGSSDEDILIKKTRKKTKKTYKGKDGDGSSSDDEYQNGTKKNIDPNKKNYAPLYITNDRNNPTDNDQNKKNKPNLDSIHITKGNPMSGDPNNRNQNANKLDPVYIANGKYGPQNDPNERNKPNLDSIHIKKGHNIPRNDTTPNDQDPNQKNKPNLDSIHIKTVNHFPPKQDDTNKKNQPHLDSVKVPKDRNFSPNTTNKTDPNDLKKQGNEPKKSNETGSNNSDDEFEIHKKTRKVTRKVRRPGEEGGEGHSSSSEDEFDLLKKTRIRTRTTRPGEEGDTDFSEDDENGQIDPNKRSHNNGRLLPIKKRSANLTPVLVPKNLHTGKELGIKKHKPVLDTVHITRRKTAVNDDLDFTYKVLKGQKEEVPNSKKYPGTQPHPIHPGNKHLQPYQGPKQIQPPPNTDGLKQPQEVPIDSVPIKKPEAELDEGNDSSDEDILIKKVKTTRVERKGDVDNSSSYSSSKSSSSEETMLKKIVTKKVVKSEAEGSSSSSGSESSTEPPEKR